MVRNSARLVAFALVFVFVAAARPALAAPGLSCMRGSDWRGVLLQAAGAARRDELCLVAERAKTNCPQVAAKVTKFCANRSPLDDGTASHLLQDRQWDCQDWEKAANSLMSAKSPAAPTVAEVPPAVHSDWQTRVIDGFTGFVAKRAKAEAVSFVFDGIGRKLCAVGEGDLAAKDLFTGTCALAAASGRARLLMSPGRLVREAMRADLVQLPARLAAGVGDQSTACALAVVAGVGAGLAANTDPMVALVGSVRDESGRWLKCTGGGNGDPWAKVWPVVEAVACRVATRGAELDTWAADPGALVDALAQDLGEDGTPWVRPVLSEIVPRAVRVELLVKALRERTAKEGELEAARHLAGASLELAAVVALSRENWRDGATAKTRADVAQASSIARQLVAGEFAAGISALAGSGLLGEAPEPAATIVRFAPFIAEVGEARSSDEVAAAFELAAAPAGSWRFRRSEVAIGVAARAGVLTANEYANGKDSHGLTLGPWVPLGFDVSIPCHGSALGLFVQALDAGALGTTRLSGSGAERAKVEARVGFAQLVSPGVALYWGIGNSPFVLSVGASMVPGLRDVEGETRGGTNVRRFGVGLGIDIPIFLW